MKIKAWNLIQLEYRLHKEKRNGDAWDIRQILDALSPNWKIVKKVDDLIINEKECSK